MLIKYSCNIISLQNFTYESLLEYSFKKYLKSIRPFYKQDLIKVITGIRRCGKSVILTQIMDEFKIRTDNVY